MQSSDIKAFSGSLDKLVYNRLESMYTLTVCQ